MEEIRDLLQRRSGIQALAVDWSDLHVEAATDLFLHVLLIASNS